MPSVYYKISAANGRWLDEISEAAGITKAHAIDLILARARAQEWVIIPGEAPRADLPGRTSPAAGPATSSQEDTASE